MVSDQTLRKHGKELMALYKKLYVEHCKSDPEINSNTDIWVFVNMLNDMTKPMAIEVIEYYFDEKEYRGQNLRELGNNYMRYKKTMEQKKVDAQVRAQLKKESAERVRLWRERKSS